MTKYHAVILDECGHEYGVTVEAASREEAYDKVREVYPENRGILQLESPDDTRKREEAMHRRIQWELDNDMDYDDRYY